MIGNIQNLAAKKIWNTTMLVQAFHGIKIGCGVFILAVFFKDKFEMITAPAFAVTAIMALYGFHKILTVLLEVPTGALGDMLGRKWSVILNYISSFFHYLFLAMLPFCDSFTLLIVMSILAIGFDALASTFYSGSFTAWCVDTLRQKAPEVGYEQLLAPAKKVYLLSCLLSGILSIFLYLNGHALVSG